MRFQNCVLIKVKNRDLNMKNFGICADATFITPRRLVALPFSLEKLTPICAGHRG
jgi:hypothetical protein